MQAKRGADLHGDSSRLSVWLGTPWTNRWFSVSLPIKNWKFCHRRWYLLNFSISDGSL